MRKEVTFTISTSELAQAFAELDAREQARFFNEVDVISRQWPMGGCMQWFEVGKQIKERKMFECEQIFKDILNGFEVSDGISNGLPPTKQGHFGIARLWSRLTECEQDAVYDFALDIERAKQ